MRCFGKEVAHASSVLGRGARHTVTAAPLAGSVTFSWGQLSTRRALNASYGFIRPYSSIRMAEELEKAGLKRIERPRSQLDAPDDRMFTVGEWPTTLQEKPEVLFDLSAPTLETSENWESGRIRRIAGYSSDSETIKIFFEREDGDSARPGRTLKLSKLYLRDVCQCSRCVCPATRQKTFATCDIPHVPQVLSPEADHIRLSADGGLEITWKDDFLTGDDHTSVYPEEFVNGLAYANGRGFSRGSPKRECWDAAKFSRGLETRAIDFQDWMKGGTEFAQAILNLHTHGLVFMHGVPSSRDSVQMIAEKIGHLQSTIHGLTWDVVSEPEAGNASCASERLQQSSLYLHDQPALQFVHCLENDSVSNVSLFSDGLKAAWKLKNEDEDSFSALSTQLVSYNYRNDGYNLYNRHPVIHLSKAGNPMSVAWSPAWQAPFRVSELRVPNHLVDLAKMAITFQSPSEDYQDKLRAWSRASGVFRDEVESLRNVVTYRHQPGHCVIFDNMRILHGTRQLSAPTGRKHVRGAYVGTQTLRSAYERLLDKGLLRQGPRGVVSVGNSDL